MEALTVRLAVCRRFCTVRWAGRSAAKGRQIRRWRLARQVRDRARRRCGRRPGSRNVSVPTATRSRPRPSDRARGGPVCTPPMPTIGSPTRPRDLRHLGERDGAHGRARHAAGAAAEPRLAVARGCSAMPRSVLISETASAPAASAAAATAAGDGRVRA